MPRFTLYAFEGDRDQVVRLHEFKAARPEWNISFDYTVGVARRAAAVPGGVGGAGRRTALARGAWVDLQRGWLAGAGP